MKSFFITILLVLLLGCQSGECGFCDTESWISEISSEELINQITPVLKEQAYKDSLNINYTEEKKNIFLIARDTLRKNYAEKTLKWFREHPNSWISIRGSTVKVSIKYCEIWCEDKPYVSQLYLVKSKSNPKLLWEEYLAEVEKSIHINASWYIIKTKCFGCGV